MRRILVTGGAGYVGAVLIPKLTMKGYAVTVLDLYLYGENTLSNSRGSGKLKEIKGDIRDNNLLNKALSGCDTVIHLACISNDPSFELNPSLGRSINYDAFLPLVRCARQNGVKRFIFASSSSVYGIKKEKEVTEDLSLEPLTDYSKYKALCEDILLREATDDFIVSIIRPATVCGYSPRLRLDLTVNILTNFAVNKGMIRVFGGEQLRPNLHINDMADLYLFMLEQPAEKIHKKTFNAGYENYQVRRIADMVKSIINPSLPIETVVTDDNRSYHISSEKLRKELGFIPQYSVEKAICDLREAFQRGKIPDPFEDERYYNIKTMQKAQLV